MPSPNSDTNDVVEKLLPKDYKIFVEQLHLRRNNWNQCARWIEYEEIVEDGSYRWSKPYVPILHVTTLEKISEMLTFGHLFQEVECNNYIELVNRIIGNLIQENRMSPIDVQVLKDTLLLPHKHQRDLANTKNNNHLKNSLPNDIDGTCIMNGEIKGLVKPICILARLKTSTVLEELTEVKVPVKFVFIYLTNSDNSPTSKEVGAGFGILITEQDILKFCYETSNLYRLTSEIECYLHKCSILPPNCNSISRLPLDTIRSELCECEEPYSVELRSEENYDFWEESGLVRSGTLFGGLLNDIYRKKPHFISDFRGFFSTQIISSIFFMYFACLTALLTFGGLLAKGTGNNMAAVESFAGAFLNGIIYGLFAGQPLSLLGSTGPLMIYESIVFELCSTFGWDYITFRFWIGMWVTAFLLILVGIDASALISYVTRFTEESFALVVCAIFLTTPAEYLIKQAKEHVVLKKLDPYNASCNTFSIDDNNQTNTTIDNLDNCLNPNQDVYDPAIFLMSTLLVTFTCGISMFLKNFIHTSFFALRVRLIISEFAVFLTVVGMCTVDYIMGLNTDKLPIPEGFTPTLETRDWYIPPFHEKNPWWSCFAAVIPAIVATILIFMNNQITTSIICRKENKLKKGVGYHLDLLWITLLIFINSFFGLPWFNAAILLSIGHLDSLKLEEPPSSLGAKPIFNGHNEQRLTCIAVSILLGASIFLAPLLKHVPLPVLYGVFLYMGVTSITKLQLVQRLSLFFMPVKYMPDYLYLQKVRSITQKIKR